MTLLPGPLPLRQVLDAALAHGANRERVKEARQAVASFEHLIRHEFDDRAGLDAALVTKVPEMRRRHELAARQAVFRGMEATMGISCDLMTLAFVVHPSKADPTKVDLATMFGQFKIRRLRPDARVGFVSEFLGTGDDRPNLGLPAQDGPLMREFCHPADLSLSQKVAGKLNHYIVDGNAIGRSSAMDIVLSEYLPNRMESATILPAEKIRYITTKIGLPCKHFVFDLLIHESVWPKSSFEMRIYDPAVMGAIDLNNSKQLREELETGEHIQTLSLGVDRMRLSKTPKYVEVLNSIAGRLNWDPSKFRGFRCSIAYPIYASQICLVQVR